MPATDSARLLGTLQRLLEIPATDLAGALTHAANALAESLGADKVDAFLYDDTRDSLVAVGVSTQPLSDLEKQLGLDVLPLSNGGRVVHVFNTGQVFRTGDLQSDPEELRGVKEGLKVRSTLGVPLQVGSRRRGMVMIASLQPGFFSDDDETFARSAVHWVGVVAHRAALLEEIERNARHEGRRTAAEELVTVLAHDIRNYLAPVTGRLYMVRHRAQGDGRERDLEDIVGALNAVSRLGGLVSNLLDIARIDRGLFELDLEPVDLVALVREAAAALSTPGHAIVVEASDAVVVTGDPARMRQCLDNLLSNAINHSPAEAAVNVFITRVHAAGRDCGQVEVVDQGAGIPQDILPHLFERFVTGRGKEGGMGLGLHLARRIAVAHGGDVTAEAGSGGARFLARFPLFEAARRPASVSPP